MAENPVPLEMNMAGRVLRRAWFLLGDEDDAAYELCGGH
jgi:hypothetical protein